MKRIAWTLMVALTAAAAITACGCLASQRSSQSGRDTDGRAIGADVGVAKGNATTQPVSDGSVGQVGGVNSAITYASGFGAGVVFFLTVNSILGFLSAKNDNSTQNSNMNAMKEVALAAINKQI